MDGHFLKADPMNLHMLCNVDFLNRSAFFFLRIALCNLHAFVIMYIFNLYQYFIEVYFLLVEVTQKWNYSTEMGMKRKGIQYLRMNCMLLNNFQRYI